MTNPSALHDPLAKLTFPDAPLVSQLRGAAERERQEHADGGWCSLLEAAADKLEPVEKAQKEKTFQQIAEGT